MQNNLSGDTLGETPGLSLPWRPLVGGFLLIMGLLVFVWVGWEIIQLYYEGNAFRVFEDFPPTQIIVMESATTKLYLPREILVYGLPLWVLGLAIQLGSVLLKTSGEYMDKKTK